MLLNFIYKPAEKIFATFSAILKLLAQAIAFTLRHPKQQPVLAQHPVLLLKRFHVSSQTHLFIA